MKKILLLGVFVSCVFAQNFVGKYVQKSSFYDGEVEIKSQNGNSIVFSVDGMNTRNTHMCTFEGVAKLNGNVAVFKKKSELVKNQTFEMSMKFNDGVLDIIANGQHDDCGMNVTIDGRYVVKPSKQSKVLTQQQKWKQEKQARDVAEKEEKQARLQKFVGIYTNEDNPHEVSERYHFEVIVKEGSTNSVLIKGYKKEDMGDTVKICKMDEPLEFKTDDFYYFENISPYDVERIIDEKKAEILSDNSLTQAQKNWDIKEMEKKVRYEYSGDKLNQCRSRVDINDRDGEKAIGISSLCESFCYEARKKETTSNSNQNKTNHAADELKQSINKLKSLLN